MSGSQFKPITEPNILFLAGSDLRVAGENPLAGTPVNMRQAGVSEEQLW